ncbi:hypothetical protein DPMN_189130 [Dreissena polymorpha]|uniref:Uncharacterized protein n=1 Tax=Dreissena polymorpha TaxID=45954 RepID=A0A9D4DTS0_DREPO|nr:hypothetical protein DPMN_189130 [Dreissena polymorpha]
MYLLCRSRLSQSVCEAYETHNDRTSTVDITEKNVRLTDMYRIINGRLTNITVQVTDCNRTKRSPNVKETEKYRTPTYNDEKVGCILSIMWQSYRFWQVKVSVLSCCLQVRLVPQLCITCITTASNVSPDELVVRIHQS